MWGVPSNKAGIRETNVIIRTVCNIKRFGVSNILFNAYKKRRTINMDMETKYNGFKPDIIPVITYI